MTTPSDAVSRGLERLLPAYARADVTIVRGEGARVWDDDGHEYLDFGGGIAVVSLGHCHPGPLAAAHEQLDRLWHASNLYRTEPAEALAASLSARFGGAQAFFCNSGAEAIEAALKYARKATGKPGVVALEGGFHGRTFGALSATGQPAKQKPFEPLVPGVRFVPPNDMDALRDSFHPDVGLVLLEPILGEGGVIPLDEEFVKAAADLPALLCLDEIQTGVGRTGTFFAFEALGVRPDLVTLAKGLGNGLPIGGLLVADEAAGAFVPGDHGSTFGGNPVSCAAALATLDVITEDGFLGNVAARGRQLAAGLAEMAQGDPGLAEVRSLGLMVAAEFRSPETGLPDTARVAAILGHCLDDGHLILMSAGTYSQAVRFMPPLVVSEAEIDEGLRVFEKALKATR